MNQGETERSQEPADAFDSKLLAPFDNTPRFGNSLEDGFDSPLNQDTNNVNISNSVKQGLDDVVKTFNSIHEEDSGESSGIQLHRIKTECENGNDNEMESHVSMNDGNSDEVLARNELDDDWVESKQELVDENIPIRTFHPNGGSTNDRNIQWNNPRSSLGINDSIMADEADLSINQNSNGMRIKEELDIELKQGIIDEDISNRRFNLNDVSLYCGYNTNSNVSNKNSAGSSSQLKDDKEKTSCSKDAKRFMCKHCEYRSDYKGNLDRHLRTHTNEKPFRCSRCAKCFTQSSALKSHMAMHKDEFPFHCSNCFRGFFQHNEKEAHEKSCTYRHYECSICKYVTGMKSNLVAHMRTHSGNKPYRCSRCSKGFTALRSLKYHMTTHNDERLPFHCKGCLHRFPKVSEQKDHEKDCRYHRYECDICKKYVTARKTQMERHMRVHTGEKPFRCEVCMKCFNVKCNLKRHMKNIHNRSNL